MIDFLNDIDTSVFLFFHNIRDPFLDSFMWYFSKKLIWIPMYAAILFFTFYDFSWRKAVICVLALALTITLADQICATFIRPYCERLRPTNPENPLSAMVTLVNGYRSGRYGFPSCHAANTFALATIIALIARQRRLTVFMFIRAAITCYSRVYLGVHYPGDLLVGAVVGSICGLIVYYAALYVSSRIFPTPALRASGNDILRMKSPDIITLVGIVTILVIIVISLCKA